MALSNVAVAFQFSIEFDGVRIDRITEVSGLKMEQDVVEVEENAEDGKLIRRKQAGKPKSGEVTLVRGMTDDHGFDDWIKASRFGQEDRVRGGSIILQDQDGTAIKRYNLTNAWPKSLEVNTLKAGDNSVVTEKLVIVYEDMEPE